MNFKTLITLLLLFILIFLPSCKKKANAVLIVTIQNYTVEYKFWSASYDIKLKEASGNDCTVFQDVLTIVDNAGATLYTRTIPLNIVLPGCASKIESYSGLLIGPYALSLYPKPVTLRHTFHFTTTETGENDSASGEIVIHEN